MTKSNLIKGLSRLTILAAVVLLVPAGVFADTVAVDDFAITAKDTPVTINVLANDTPGNGTWDMNKITIVDKTGPSNGKAEYIGDGQFKYTPNQGFVSPVVNGKPVPDTFEYEACDTEGKCGDAWVDVIVAIEVPLNIITRKLNVNKMGVIPVDIRSRGDFDITTVDPESLMLQGVVPVRSNMPAGKKLTLKVHAQEIVQALGGIANLTDRQPVILQLTGATLDGYAIFGEDSVIILKNSNNGKHGKP